MVWILAVLAVKYGGQSFADEDLQAIIRLDLEVDLGRNQEGRILQKTAHAKMKRAVLISVHENCSRSFTRFNVSGTQASARNELLGDNFINTFCGDFVPR